MTRSHPNFCSLKMIKNIVISGTNFWNPGDDFVRDGVLKVLKRLFHDCSLNLLFYNFNADFFPQNKFSGISNLASLGDLNLYRDHIDAVIIAGLSAGHEIKDLYRWVVENRLEGRVVLIGAGYENNYVAKHITEEPEATIFKNARLIVGRTQKTPDFIHTLKVPYAHLNCPALLSVDHVKTIPAGHGIRTIGFSIQLPHGHGVVNQTCAAEQYQLAVDVLLALSQQYSVEVVAHHKSEYFYFLNQLRVHSIPVRFSSFYHDLFEIFRRYDLVVTTRLHASLFANGHGIPGIIINDTDRHTHTLEGFPHSRWVNSRESFDREFQQVCCRDLAQIAIEASEFKQQLMEEYLKVLDILKTETTSEGYRFDSEEKEQLMVRDIVQPGMTVFDVGANIGKYTKLFSLLVGSQGRVVSFEPDPTSKLRIANRLREDGLTNVTLVAKAVVGQDGPVILNQFPEEYSSWNSLGRPQMEDPQDSTRLVPIVNSIEVKAVTLDTYCREQNIQQIDYLKLDVEGAEIHALHGAQGLLSVKAIRYLQFEISQKMLEGLNTKARLVFDFLASHGYECHAIGDKGMIGDKVIDSDSFYENYIAFPSQSAPIATRSLDQLPIHFLTIVLNGQPFIQHHIEVLRRLPFKWHWHIVEGVAELNHDTAWSRKTGGRISHELHRNGLSHDGTAEFLDEMAQQFPDHISIYRKPDDEMWDGKLEMVNCPLKKITQECLLWQLDVDELWTVEQIIRGRELFLRHPNKTAAFYRCHYFVGENRVITTRDTYGNHTDFEWLRTWKFTPGCRWVAHEPPRLCCPTAGGQLIDLAKVQPILHNETESHGLIFQHFAYVTEEQLRFKEIYYGYQQAVGSWLQLQSQTNFPLRLADYFQWVNDGALVHTAESQGIVPLAKKDQEGGWNFSYNQAESLSQTGDPKRVLFVRTDSIGDTVLAMSMLSHLRQKYPESQLVVLCQEHISELYLATPFVNAVICFDREKAWSDEAYRKTIIQEIGEFGPDLTLNSLYSREPLTELLILTNRQGKIVGLEGDLSNISEENRNHCNPLYTQLIPSQGTHRSELVRHRDFLNGLGIAVDNLEPHVWTLPEDEAEAETFFQEHNLDPAKTIAFFPFPQQECRFYPYYPEVLRSFVDYHMVILGGPESVDSAAKMEKEIPTVINLVGKTTLRTMAALLRKCRLYIGAESAGAHMACAVGLPNVVIMGGGHFGRFIPYSPLTSMVCLPLECYGCNWVCSYERVHCVKDLDPSVIREAVAQTLRNHSAKPRVFIQQENTKGEIPQWANPVLFLDSKQVEVIRVEPIDQRDGSKVSNQYIDGNSAIFKKQINQNGKEESMEAMKMSATLAFEPKPNVSLSSTKHTESLVEYPLQNTIPSVSAIQTSELVNPLIADISSRAVKQRVLSVLTKLEKDYWLEKNIQRLHGAIEAGDSGWDTSIFLNWYSFTFQPTNYLEVGVRRGRSMAMVLKESPKTEAYGFDLWIPDYSSLSEAGIYTTNPGPDFVQAELSKLGIVPRCQLTVGKSQETLPRFFENPVNPQLFDLILIDGDHTFEGAKKDLDIAFSHLAPGGALVFDDITHPAHLELKELWDSFKTTYQEFFFIEDTMGMGTGVAFCSSFEKLCTNIAHGTP